MSMEFHLKVTFFLLRQALPISLRIRLYNFLWDLGIKFYGPTDFFVQRLPFTNVYMKRGPKAVQESTAIRTVKTHTRRLPVPAILDVIPDSCFLMSGLSGEPLSNIFTDLSPDALADIQAALASMLAELREIPHPLSDMEPHISGPLPSMPCSDLTRFDALEFGPFECCKDFQDYTLSRSPATGKTRKVIASKAASIHETKPYRVVFTHADLNLRNILVKNGKISGIVDWTCAGWFPEYWELTKAIHVHPRLKKWAKFWMGVLPGYEEELEVERLLWGVV